jgi:hypothetical protein
VAQAEASADYACPVDKRLAAASALADSRIMQALGAAGGASGDDSLLLRAWLLAVALLQDEEPAVRAAAGDAVCAALGCAPRPSHLLLSAAVSHCAERFGAVARLHAWLLDATCGRLELDLGGGRDGGGLTRRLFDKEADNHHAEAMRMAQLAARELGFLARAGRLGEDARRAAVEELDAAAARSASELAGARASDQEWGAGLTCHESVFMPLYRLLLGLHALGAHGAGHGSLLAELRAEQAVSRLHPLLAAMLAHVSGDSGQEPFFLLRSGLDDSE